MTDFVRVRDSLGFHRSVPKDRIPEGATVLDGERAAIGGYAIEPTGPHPEEPKPELAVVQVKEPAVPTPSKTPKETK